MTEIRRQHNTQTVNGFGKSNLNVTPSRLSDGNSTTTTSSSTTHNTKTTTTNDQPLIGTRQEVTNKQIRRYYIDELGFYRHLDPDQKQYVCSNLNATIVRATTTTTSGNGNLNIDNSNQKLSNGGGDGGYEICSRAIRRELGISHFDRTVGYEQWKRSWDDFMRAKLIKQEPVTLNRELKTRVRSGVPHDYRCKVWTALIRMRTRNIRAQIGEDIYEVILRDFVSKVEVPEYVSDNHDQNNNNNNKRGNKSRSSSSYIAPIVVNKNNSNQNSTTINSSSTTSSSGGKISLHEPVIEKCFRQIELDLLRTLPNNRHFEDPNSRGIQRVRRILRAYACFNPTVGYCQGMNRLAAMALLVLPEEEAFWCLVAIIQCIMPKDYYLKPWLAQVDCCVLSDLLEKKMPILHKHLAKNDIQLTLFTWFFTIFVDGFRPELMLRIWDCFLLEGDKVLFRFALSILYISQEDLLEMQDFSTMSSHLSRLVSTRRLDMEHLFDTFSTMNPLSSGTLQSRRDFHRNRMQSFLEE